MGMRKLVGGAAGTALLIALMMVMPSASQAAEVPFTSCPSEVASWANNDAAYPPFGSVGADSADGLVNCAAPFAPESSTEQNVTMTFPFAQLPTDPCNTLVSVSLTSTGTPEGAGWGFVAYNVGDPSIHYTGPSGTGDGGFQQFGATQGTLITTNGGTFYSPIAQPASGAYSVTYQLDPAQLDLATLAAGHLGVSAVVFDPGDVLTSMTVQVVVDDSACPPASSSTTSTEPTPTSTTSTTAPKVQAATSPKFTG